IAWTEHVAVGERLAQLAGVHYYGREGLNADGAMIEDERGACVASIAANHKGRNLQHFSRSFIVSCPPNAAILEQLLGRTHRDGQEADCVTADVLLGCKEQLQGFHKAQEE